MPARPFLIATAGHVDHGKTALVRALTGRDPMRLPEEKSRGITIDLGFAHAELDGGGGGSIPVSFIDVPGHEDFIKNMLAGVGATDLALLAVAADDGWMPQTEEHLQILAYLGVPKMVVALTKCDRLPGGDRGAVEAATAAVIARLSGSPYVAAPIIPTSIGADGQSGLNDLVRAMRRELSSAPIRADGEKPRLWIDRSFHLPGAGQVVTGTLAGGALRKGQEVVVLPGRTSNGPARIRGMQNRGLEVDVSLPGARTALALTGLSAAPSRGQLVTLPECGRLVRIVDVWLERMDRLGPGEHGIASGFSPVSRVVRPLAHGGVVRLHLGTASVACRVVLPGGPELPPGASSLAELRLEGDLPIEAGERFVLRDLPGSATLAGGIVLDPRARRRDFRRPAQQRFLAALAENWVGGKPVGAGARACIAAWLAREEILSLRGLCDFVPYSKSEVEAVTTGLVEDGLAVERGAFLVHPPLWQSLRAAAGAAVEEYHRARPDAPGLPLPRLEAEVSRQLGRRRLSAAGFFDVLVQDLIRQDHALAGGALRHRRHCPQLPPELGSCAEDLRRRLGAAPLDPPGRRQLAPDPEREKALRFLIRSGDVVELGPEVVLLRQAFEGAALAVRDFLRDHGRGTVSELRRAVGASRRIVVPLLERLDREGLTLRRGDERLLQRPLRAPVPSTPRQSTVQTSSPPP